MATRKITMMLAKAVKITRLWGALILGLLINTAPALSQTPTQSTLATTVRQLETNLNARIGVLVRDNGSDWQWGHREHDRFLMASTFKSLLCGAILDQVDHGLLTLDERLEIHPHDILDYAPITKTHVGKTMTLGGLCSAALDKSDNTAANLLIARLGGPQGVTSYLRRIGDSLTRLDRIEPELNVFTPNDPRDTTSPAAMVSSWQAMLLGDGLTPTSRQQLTEWMSHGGVTAKLIRSSTPKGWLVSDKSGGGRQHTRNLVAMITPPGHAPYFVAIFISDTDASWAARNSAITQIGAAVIDAIKAR